MDILTHIFLPLTLIYILKRDLKAKHFPLALFAIIPDLDVFTGVHRGISHSLLFLAPLACIILATEYVVKRQLKHSILAVGFLFSHIVLDILTGGVPLLYPLINLGVGITVPFIVRFGESISIVDAMPKIVYSVPQPVQGEMDAFSSFGVAMTAAFLIVWWRTYRGRS